MGNTLISRQPARAGLVTLFTATGSWQEVFGYFPTEDDLDGQQPFLTITAAGTDQKMSGISFNPAKQLFVIASFVLMTDDGNWTHSDAEDKIDALDLVVRQLVRDNPTASTFADAMLLDNGQSVTDLIELYGIQYRYEMWLLSINHAS